MSDGRWLDSTMNDQSLLIDQCRPSHTIQGNIPTLGLFTAEIVDPDYQFRGWLSIHSFGKRGAGGGTRLYPDVTEDEVRLLARAMTLKYCFFHRDTGGAKSGLQLPFDLPVKDRQRALRNFGACLAPLIRKGIYQPWTDMNSYFEDMQMIYAGAGITITGPIADSSYYTSLSIFAGIRATAEYMGISPANCKISIEGLGNV